MVTKISRVVLSELDFYKQGSMFGESAIKKPGYIRSTGVKALKDCVVMALAATDYSRYL